MNKKKMEQDDLTAVKYIGPKMQSWLREKLEVRTYRDLANLSVEKIQSQLNVDKKVVAKGKIEAWIEQAKEFANKAELESKGRSPNKTHAVSDVGERVGLPKKAREWEEYATFMVYFEARKSLGKVEKRIKVFHIEEDKSRVWSDLTAENFLWMLNQAGEGPFLKAPQQKSVEAFEDEELKPEEPLQEAKVNIKEVRLFQPPEAEKPLAVSNGKTEHQKLKAGEPFSLEVLFSLGGEAAESVIEQHATYSVNVVAKEAHTKVGVDLGSSEPEELTEGTFDYRIRLPEATLSSGEHQLWAMVSVQATNTVPNFLEGPSVKVS